MITTLQAFLLALLVFYIKSTFSPNLTFYWSKPLIMGLFVGLIMGDMSTALSAAISIQLIYIGVMGIGSVTPADTCIATVMGCSLAVALKSTGVPMEESTAAGLAAAAAIGAPATAFSTLVYTIDTFFNEKSKDAALKGNTKAQRLWQWLPNQIIQFCIYVPIIFICEKAMGSAGFLDTLNNVLTPISKHLKVAANVLPAVGIALAIRTIISGETVPYLIIGFALVSYFGVSVLAVSVIAACIAVIVGYGEYRKQQEAKSDFDELDDLDV